MASNQFDDEASRRNWLRIQGEKYQNEIVTVKSGMSFTPALYFGTRRSTYSDVISIVTTVQPLTDDFEDFPVHDEKNGKGEGEHLSEIIYSSPLQEKSERLKYDHKRRSEALLREKRWFTKNLSEQRDERFKIETEAAIVIQGVYRGHTLRRNFNFLKKKLRMRKKVRSGMQKVTQGTNIILEEKERIKRRSTIQSRAATVIQQRYRMILSRLVARKERGIRLEEFRNDQALKIQCLFRKNIADLSTQKRRKRYYENLRLCSSLVIQRYFKGYCDRKRVFHLRLRIAWVASLIIQNSYRAYLAQKMLSKELQHVKQEEVNLASIIIQRIYRGKIGRRRVYQIRNSESEEIQEASVLAIQRCFRGLLGRKIARDRAYQQKEENLLHLSMYLQKIVRAFLDRKFIVQFRDEEKSNIFTQTRLGNDEIVDDLFSGFGTEQTYTVNDVDEKGNTILLVACRFGYKKIARKCLRWGMNIDHENKKGETAVMLAVIHGHSDVAEYLLSRKATVNFYGRTLLHEAAKNGMSSTASNLIIQGINVNEREENGKLRIPLHEAVINGDVKTIRVLLDKKANINARDGDGYTPMHYAAENGNFVVILVLFEYNPDVSIADNQDRTPWRLAVLNSHEECAIELRKKWNESM